MLQRTARVLRRADLSSPTHLPSFPLPRPLLQLRAAEPASARAPLTSPPFQAGLFVRSARILHSPAGAPRLPPPAADGDAPLLEGAGGLLGLPPPPPPY